MGNCRTSSARPCNPVPSPLLLAPPAAACHEPHERQLSRWPPCRHRPPIPPNPQACSWNKRGFNALVDGQCVFFSNIEMEEWAKEAGVAGTS